MPISGSGPRRRSRWRCCGSPCCGSLGGPWSDEVPRPGRLVAPRPCHRRGRGGLSPERGRPEGFGRRLLERGSVWRVVLSTRGWRRVGRHAGAGQSGSHARGGPGDRTVGTQALDAPVLHRAPGGGAPCRPGGRGAGQCVVHRVLRRMGGGGVGDPRRWRREGSGRRAVPLPGRAAVVRARRADDRTPGCLRGDHVPLCHRRDPHAHALHTEARADHSGGLDERGTRTAPEPGGIRSSIGVAGSPPRRTILPAGFAQGASTLVAMNTGDARPELEATMLSKRTSQPLGSLVQNAPNAGSAQPYPVSMEEPSAIDVRSTPGTVVALRTLGISADQGSTGGASAPAAHWVVLPSIAGTPAHPGLILANPGDVPAAVQLSLLPSSPGIVPPPVTVTVRPGRVVAGPK